MARYDDPPLLPVSSPNDVHPVEVPGISLGIASSVEVLHLSPPKSDAVGVVYFDPVAKLVAFNVVVALIVVVPVQIIPFSGDVVKSIEVMVAEAYRVFVDDVLKVAKAGSYVKYPSVSTTLSIVTGETSVVFKTYPGWTLAMVGIASLTLRGTTSR
jgi:hypothetical protein